MRFNRNIYMRLYQIAFFMPDIFQGGDKYEIEYTLPNPLAVPIDDPGLRDKFWTILSRVLSSKSGSNYKIIQGAMGIDVFEKRLFIVCLTIYQNLLPLFSPHQDAFRPRKQSESEEKYDFANDPEWFYKTIPQDAISKESIAEKSEGVFLSVKTACFFFCKFTPSYLLYKYSLSINKHENEIPLLTHAKEAISQYFCKYTAESFSSITDCLSELFDSLEVYSESRESFKKLQVEERSYWNSWLEKIYDGIIINCLDISERLSAQAGIPVFEYIFQEKCNSSKFVTKDERIRRNNISKSHTARLSQRKKKIQKHINEIKNISKSEKMSIRIACEQYHKKHESELKSINITSPRTLENICCDAKPNKQRSDFSNKAYVKPNYTPAFKNAINDLFHDFVHKSRSSRSTVERTD